MKKRKICVSRVLKMTSLFFLSCAMCAQAETVSSQSIRITLNKNNVRLENILNDIESQTNLLFIYNKNVNVNRKVSVNAQNTSLQEVLQNLFDNNVSFKIEGSYIVLSPAGATGSPQQAKHTVKGVVEDALGPIAGANVVEKGQPSNGTITNLDGKFTLKVTSNKAIIAISMIGMKTVEVTVPKDGKTLTVRLHDDTQTLDEVVVVAYGQQKKVSVTGSISAVGNRELKQGPTSSVTNSLTGRIPGLVTRQTSGRPGEDAAALYIRGRATVNDASPLIMVDGIERDFSQIDPDEIESISVLKDASATAVYGVRGANGVILVTTKRGNSGKAKVSFSGEFGITQINRITKMVNAEEYATLMNEGLVNEGQAPKYTEHDMQLYRDQSSPFTHPDNDYIDMFTKLGTQQKYNVNVSGGNERLKYFVSLGYFHQNGTYETDIEKLKKKPDLAKLIAINPELDNLLQQPDYNSAYYYNRFNVRTNLDIQVTKDFSIGVDFSYRTGSKNRPNSEGDASRAFNNMTRTPANAFPLVNENGTFAAVPNLVRANPLHAFLYQGYRKDNDSALEGTVKLNYDLHAITKGLSIGGKFSYNSYIEDNGMGLNVVEPVWKYNENGTYQRLLAKVFPSLINFASGAKKRVYWEAFVNYSHQFAEKHNVSGLILYNYNSHQAPGDGEYGGLPQVYQGLVARANYDFEGKYLVEINLGYNGSNRFVEGERYALFPSASVGWIVTNESFLKDSKLLPYWKIRASLGQVGNDKFGSNFAYYSEATYAAGTNYNFGESPTAASGGLLEGKAAQIVSWERSTKFNIGMDTRWFEGKLTLNAEYFRENRTNILKTPSRTNIISGVTSFSPQNLMEVKNQGVEVEVGWDHKIKDFGYRIKANIAYNHNEIIEQNEQIRKYPYMNRTGGSIGQQFSLIADGFYNTYAEIAAGPTQYGTLQPGDVRFRDINGDGVINDYDIAPFGFSDVPEITGSFQVGLSYKNFDLTVMFQGATRVTIPLTGEVAWEFFNLGSALADRHLARWTPETQQTATYHRMSNSSGSNQNNFKSSSMYLYDASYLRLKNVELSYNFPKKWFTHTPISALRMYVNGFNLLTWDKLKVIDPEAQPANRGNFYPQQRIYNLGVNVTF